jgi:hypothetical protein
MPILAENHFQLARNDTTEHPASVDKPVSRENLLTDEDQSADMVPISQNPQTDHNQLASHVEMPAIDADQLTEPVLALTETCKQTTVNLQMLS